MSRRLPRYPFVLLGAMTLFTFGGPFLIGYFLGGGASPKWPPDRPIEWAVLLGVSGMVAVLMMACLSAGFAGRSQGHGPGDEVGGRPRGETAVIAQTHRRNGRTTAGLRARLLRVPRVRYSGPVPGDVVEGTGPEYRTRGTPEPVVPEEKRP